MKNNGISTTKLADICGVSQGTVDRALNNRKGISPKTKEKILKAAKEYGYRPNIHAQSLAGGRSMLIGVVVFDLNNQYFSDLITKLEAALALHGYSVVIAFTNKDKSKEIECIQNLYSMCVDGIVLCPINKGTEFENYLLSLDIPIITVGNKLSKLPYVGIDNFKAMYDAVRFVLSKGYGGLIYVLPKLSDNSYAQEERLRGFEKAAKENKADFTVTDIDNFTTHRENGKKCAVICPTDKYAVQLYTKAKENSLGIIGFDNIGIIDCIGFELDSVSYDIVSAAEATAEYLINKKQPKNCIDHKIIIRGSI